MSNLNRRTLLGAGASLAGTATLSTAQAADASATANATATAAPDGSTNPYLFDLAGTKPTVFDGGNLRGANEENFKVLKDQKSATYLIELEVGGIREPHWHPSAWESTFVISGQSKWSILGTHPDGKYHNLQFAAGPGELVFIPEGFFHYFENASASEPLKVLVNFNNSTPEPNDDLGIVASLASLPDDVLDTVFGVPAGSFGKIAKKLEPVTITKRK